MKLFYLLAIFALSYSSASAEICTATGNGNFSNASIWSCGRVPGVGDIGVIPAGIEVTVEINNTGDIDGLEIFGKLKYTNGAKINLSNTAVINIYLGGSITGGNPGSKIIFDGGFKYSGAFNFIGPLVLRGNGVLPVNLKSFTYEKNGSAINLFWKATNEINIKNYVVEYSVDNGRTWSNAGTVAGKNNGPSDQNYQHSINPAASQKVLVRLSIGEIDGKISYSNILSISNGSATSFLVYPTTTSNNVTVSYSKVVTNTTIQIVSANGNVVKKITVTGMNNVIDVSNLQKGMYIIRSISAGEAPMTQKIIVQ